MCCSFGWRIRPASSSAPSGTEPKIKLYGCATMEKFDTIEGGIAACDSRLGQTMDALKKDTA